MAKLNDLKLHPHEGPGARTQDQQRRIDDFVARANELLDHDRYAYAKDTLVRLRDSVQGGQIPSDRMFQALENIQQGGQRQQRSALQWGRRYEGR